MYSLIHYKIKEANHAFSMFDDGDKILVALSGGADSVALLLALKEFFPEVSLYACHVNHMLRGDEADRDMDFASELCKNNGIPVEILKTDVGAYAKKLGLSTELAARNIRYDFFEKVCRKHGINKVATAHTLSDNAETVLFNLSRGTGLQGLCGIPAKRTLCDDICLIRPLIRVDRTEIESYLKKRGQTFVTDSSNLTDDYTRNYFRHNIIPLFKKVNPSFEETLGKTCDSLQKAQIFIDKNADNNITNDAYELAQLDDCVLSNVIMKLYNKATDKTLLERVHIDEIMRFIKKGASEEFRYAYEVFLPGKFSAVIKNGFLEFSPTVRHKKHEIADYRIVPCPGINMINRTAFAFIISETEVEVPDGYSLFSKDIIDKSKISGELFARNRKKGDTVYQGGMTKKVKELLIHGKVPLEIRSSLPFICDDTGIICIPGVINNDAHKQQNISKNNRLYIYIFTKTT